MENQLSNQMIDTFVAQNREALVADISKLVAHPSISGESAGPGAPFGKGPRAALDEALNIAKCLGLATGDCDGYIGWAELAGKEPGHIAAIAHVDVVPEGEGWTGDPFTLREKDGWLLGRGVLDDKGPAVLCLYAAKFFKEAGLPLRYGLRVLLGTSEETGMQDIDYYLARQPQPLFCFTPDADFPVCHGEKGHMNGVFVSSPINGNLMDFSGGIADNVVPDRATCLVKADAAQLQPTDRIAVVPEGEELTRLSAKGIGGHAAFPQGSINAISLLVDYLLANHLGTAEEEQFLSLLQKLHSATDGSGLGIDCADEVFGPLTIIGGVISLEDGRLRQRIDSRFPTAATGEGITQKLNAFARGFTASFEAGHIDPPFLMPEDSPAIQALLRVYNRVTGKSAKAFTIGGGTYARHFTQGAAFGPEEPDEVRPAFAGPIHGADEAASVDGFMTALKIYIQAIWELQQVDF